MSWFAALCDDDYEFLGVPDPRQASSWEHCRGIALAAEEACSPGTSCRTSTTGRCNGIPPSSRERHQECALLVM